MKSQSKKIRIALQSIFVLTVGLLSRSLDASDASPNLYRAASFEYLSLSEYPNSLSGTPDLQTAVAGGGQAAVDFYSMGEKASTASAFGFTLASSNPSFNQSINGTSTITLSGTGNYILKLNSVDLENNSTLTINASAGSKVVLDISGAFFVDHSQIVLSGGITSNNVVFNLTNPAHSDGPSTLGKISSARIDGAILAKSRDVVVLGSSTLPEQIVAQTLSIDGGAPGKGNVNLNLSKSSAFPILSLSQSNNTLSGSSELQTAVNGAGQAAVDFYSIGESTSRAASFGFTLDTSNPAFNQAVTGSEVVSLKGNKNFVLKLASIDLENGAVLTINASASSKVVFDIAGSFVVDHGQIVLSGGILAKNVIFNLTNPSKSDDPTTLGKVVNGRVTGTILAKSRDVAILGSSAVVKGQVIAKTVSIEGGVVVSPEF